MNNCRAGLYGFAATTTWLRETGMASPPSLVMLGLTLPDSRILNGIAGIGLTLVNIAIILPHLRQPMLDSIHASEGALTHEQTVLSSDESNATKPADLNVDSPALREHQGGSASPTISLPVPDTEEVDFFNTTDTGLFDRDPDPGETSAACEQHTGLEEVSASEDDGQMAIKAIEQGGQLVADENVALPVTKLAVDHHNPVAGEAGHSMVGGKEVPAKRRPESLSFIPQSVVRRYPSAPMISSGRCVEHRTFGSGHDHQFTLAPPHTLVHNPAMLPSGTTPQAVFTASEGHWRRFLAEVEPNTRSMGGQTLVIQTVPAHDPLTQRLTSLPHTVHQPLKKYPTHERQLGILTRTALRNRRSAARRCRNNEIDDFSTSDSDSDCDSDSQYSSGSSADEHMLPHILGADLIAAIDANSESELNLAGFRRTNRAPLDVYEDFLVSEDSAADVSMIMHVSSHDGAFDGEVKAPVTLRSLTYEDIQQWASGVVQKCVRQVCRSRVPVAPLSPSQASDVCAERPSGSGISQCPLSGLHCKLGAVALAQVPAPKTKELPPAPTLPTRKLLPVRNVRDIPEFVPRQRHVSRVDGPLGPSTRSNIDGTRDAASEVIARMESQAGFNTRQWLADEIRTVRGCQGMPRCA